MFVRIAVSIPHFGSSSRTCFPCYSNIMLTVGGTIGTLDSPEWRKGPSGPKTLCNACGREFFILFFLTLSSIAPLNRNSC